MPSSAEHRAKYEANRHFLDTGNNGTPLSTQKLVAIETYVNNIFNPPVPPTGTGS